MPVLLESRCTGFPAPRRYTFRQARRSRRKVSRKEGNRWWRRLLNAKDFGRRKKAERRAKREGFRPPITESRARRSRRAPLTAWTLRGSGRRPGRHGIFLAVATVYSAARAVTPSTPRIGDAFGGGFSERDRRRLRTRAAPSRRNRIVRASHHMFDMDMRAPPTATRRNAKVFEVPISCSRFLTDFSLLNYQDPNCVPCAIRAGAPGGKVEILDDLRGRPASAIATQFLPVCLAR